MVREVQIGSEYPTVAERMLRESTEAGPVCVG